MNRRIKKQVNARNHALAAARATERAKIAALGQELANADAACEVAYAAALDAFRAHIVCLDAFAQAREPELRPYRFEREEAAANAHLTPLFEADYAAREVAFRTWSTLQDCIFDYGTALSKFTIAAKKKPTRGRRWLNDAMQDRIDADSAPIRDAHPVGWAALGYHLRRRVACR